MMGRYVWGQDVTTFNEVCVCGCVQVDLCKLDRAVPQEVLCHAGYRIGSGADPHIVFSFGRGEDFDGLGSKEEYVVISRFRVNRSFRIRTGSGSLLI